MCEIVKVHQTGIMLSMALTLLRLPNPYVFQTVPPKLFPLSYHTYVHMQQLAGAMQRPQSFSPGQILLLAPPRPSTVLTPPP